MTSQQPADVVASPPTSKLVSKLFPKLKPQKPKLTPAQVSNPLLKPLLQCTFCFVNLRLGNFIVTARAAGAGSAFESW